MGRSSGGGGAGNSEEETAVLGGRQDGGYRRLSSFCSDLLFFCLSLDVGLVHKEERSWKVDSDLGLCMEATLSRQRGGTSEMVSYSEWKFGNILSLGSASDSEREFGVLG